MDIVILILLSVMIFVNLLVGVVIVRTRESHEVQLKAIADTIQRLTKELVVRLPPRPYGVGDETPASLTTGPYDPRLN